MPLVTIDGKEIEVAAGATVMDAAQQLGIYIPHFCYHKKLSIAASCRMCLVEVEKSPKPLPACATPVSDGMVVSTHSSKAVDAQKGVMELLLINHPLDCPICDQGGECMLQDIAVGYGGGASDYSEPKRVVKEKDLGPLIATDMTRCIHCSRCVRFGQEIAGIMELGMPGRGEHTEVMPFLERHVNSELSGNVIELCPVGALTSKPFRYNARSWELSRRRSVSPHDGLGANLALHVKGGRVLRATPVDNEAINECWLADRDRYSYEGINSPDRLTRPMLKDAGRWIEVDWQTALAQAAGALKVIRDTHGGEAIGVLASPRQSVEELYLLQRIARGLGCENIDHRLAQADMSADLARQGVPWLGMPIAEVNQLERVLLIGATLRQEQPLLAQRLRQAVKKGAQLNVVHAAGDDLLCATANQLLVKPSAMLHALAQVLRALQDAGANVPGEMAGKATEVTDVARGIAASLLSGERKAVWLGAWAAQHPAYGELQAMAQAIASATGARFGYLVGAANGVGAGLVGCEPGQGGLTAAGMFAQPRKAYVLLGVEPEIEANDAQQARHALGAAELVIALSAFKGQLPDYAHVILPIVPFAETDGGFVNMEGRLQTFRAAVPPQGEARPAWKVLRVLASQLGLDDLAFNHIEDVRAAALPGGEAAFTARLDNGLRAVEPATIATIDGLERLAEVPLYHADALVRRAPALQSTEAGGVPALVGLNATEIQRLGLAEGKPVKVVQGSAETVLRLKRDDALPDGVVRVAACHAMTAGLGPRHAGIRLEKM
jgi:NADH-quinone oxidoreductase subunit G